MHMHTITSVLTRVFSARWSDGQYGFSVCDALGVGENGMGVGAVCFRLLADGHRQLAVGLRLSQERLPNRHLAKALINLRLLRLRMLLTSHMLHQKPWMNWREKT